MTLKEFAEKWGDKNLPQEASPLLGTAIGMLEHAGLSKEEISELAGDVFDLVHYLATVEGLAEFDFVTSEEEKETKH